MQDTISDALVDLAGRLEGERDTAEAAGRIDVNRRAKLTSFRRPTLTRVGRLFEGSWVSDFI
jgi:hypothetical protein